MKSLQEHEVYRPMTRYLSLRSVPKGKKSISCSFVFKQEADNWIETELIIKATSRSPVSATDNRLD